ncbi:hypothetical protein K469DRAFT_758674 [Zopfia rhizophila CBS 207.26]|uniref:Uncharacterized protein n=1 Tax=Zopfia rhizophila CBS 207.26 TaxID=1314779 RepID=A0A6A6EY94_9PEZI|nr:hypothetical protein K469DRAFT_758674 [Zopfia rhizophila CBS 207.26]
MNDTTRMVCSPSADATFGSVVEGYRSNFNFTLTFEQYFLSILASAVFLIFAPLRVKLFGRGIYKSVETFTIALVRNYSLISIFANLQLTTVILWTIQHPLRSTFLQQLPQVFSHMLYALSYLENSRSRCPSALLNASLHFYTS